MEKQYKLGLLPSPPDARDFCVQMPPRVVIPEEWTAPEKVPDIGDQEVSDCSAWALGYIYEMAYLFRFSKNYAYLDRICEYKGEGMYLRDILDFALKIGNVPFEHWDKEFEVPGGYAKIAPHIAALREIAKKYRIKAYARVYSMDEAKLARMNGLKVIFSAAISSFRTDNIGLFRATGGKGNHAMTFFDWSKVKDNAIYRKLNRILNSWGKGWGINGTCYMYDEDMWRNNEVWAIEFERIDKPTPEPSPIVRRSLRLKDPYMRGDDVKELQTELNELGYDCGKTDGIFGKQTDAAVRWFQQVNGLVVDGIVGEKTWKKLYGSPLPAPKPSDNVLDFIRWALTHVKKESIPAGAQLALSVEQCGYDPWEYLYGTTARRATQSLLDAKYNNPYKGWGWNRAEYDKATASWVDRGVTVCDCQGLADAYCTQILGVRTDLNAQGNYDDWCTEKTKDMRTRPYVIGEALFAANDDNDDDIGHVGWICGFDKDGEPLIVEERGLSYGCVVTRFKDRLNKFNRRGLMTRRFSYDLQPVPEPEPEPTPEPEPLKLPCTLQLGSVEDGYMRIRTGPDTQYPYAGSSEAAKVFTGEKVLALEEQSGWYRVVLYRMGAYIYGWTHGKGYSKV